MYPILTIAAKGLATRSETLEAVARSVASRGTMRSARIARAPANPPVRIAALPAVGRSIEEIVALVEVERAYRASAAVMATAAGMISPRIETIDSEPQTETVDSEHKVDSENTGPGRAPARAQADAQVASTGNALTASQDFVGEASVVSSVE